MGRSLLGVTRRVTLLGEGPVCAKAPSKHMSTKLRRVQIAFCGWKVEFQGRGGWGVARVFTESEEGLERQPQCQT